MFVKEDIAKVRLIKEVIKQGKYELKGDAIQAVASLISWLDELEKKIIPEGPVGMPKPIEEPIKPMDKKDKK